MVESLKDKTIRGTFWSAIDNVANLGVSFIVSVILARLLTPSEYGILAMIQIFIAVSTTIVDSGFSNALIRKQDLKLIDYNTTFCINMLVSVLLYFILYIAAPTISIFFKEPILVDVTRVIGIILIINALAIIPRTIFVRNVNFKTQTKVSLISSITGGIIGIGMAVAGMGVWSLVGQQLSRQLLNTIFLFIYCKWRPMIEFSYNSFKKLFGFGSKLLLSGLLDTIYKNIYYFIIGKFYSSAQLGQYTRADQFNTIFSSNLTSVVQRVSYPVLSSIQNDDERLREAYRRVIKTTMLVTFACMLGLAAIAKSLIIVLIGVKWLPAVYFLQIICFAGMLYPLHAINLNILQVKGRSDIFLLLEIIKKIIAVGPILIGIFYGIEYMLWGSVLISFIAYFLNSYYSAGLIHYPIIRQIKDIVPTFFISMTVASVMWVFSLLTISNYILLPLQCIIGLMLSIFIYERTKLPEYLEIKQIILSIISKYRKNG